MKYRKKPVVIEAFKYDGDFQKLNGEYYIPQWGIDAYKNGVLHFESLDTLGHPCELFIKTLEGDMKASVGDYIIQGVNGELYACKPDIFEKTYEAVGGLSAEHIIGELKLQANVDFGEIDIAVAKAKELKDIIENLHINVDVVRN